MDKPLTIKQALMDGYYLLMEFNLRGFEAQLIWPGCIVCRGNGHGVFSATANLENEMARLGWPQIERRRDELTQMYKPELRPAENGSARGRGQGWIGILLQPLRNAFRR